MRIASQHTGPIHVMLTDIVMPGVKGEELAEQIRAVRPDLKVLYMSAYTEDAVLNLGILAPGTNFIEKPFGIDDLARKVRESCTDGRPKVVNQEREITVSRCLGWPPISNDGS